MTETKTVVSVPKRLEYIDALRALAVLFVVIIHAAIGVDGWNVYTVFTGAIMIPLFFIISGYLFNPRDGKQLPFFKNLFFKMVIPRFFISQLWIQAFFIPSKGIHFWLRLVWDFICGDLEWFLLTCIIGEIIFFYIRKFFKSPIAITACCLVFFAGGLFSGDHSSGAKSRRIYCPSRRARERPLRYVSVTSRHLYRPAPSHWEVRIDTVSRSRTT